MINSSTIISYCLCKHSCSDCYYFLVLLWYCLYCQMLSIARHARQRCHLGAKSAAAALSTLSKPTQAAAAAAPRTQATAPTFRRLGAVPPSYCWLTTTLRGLASSTASLNVGAKDAVANGGQSSTEVIRDGLHGGGEQDEVGVVAEGRRHGFSDDGESADFDAREGWKADGNGEGVTTDGGGGRPMPTGEGRETMLAGEEEEEGGKGGGDPSTATKDPLEMRLSRRIARSGLASRREAER